MAVEKSTGPAALVLTATVARRYYLEGESKSEIATSLGLSRFKVARLLDRALATGLVRIEIDSQGEIDLDLSVRVSTAYGLRHCIVMDTDEEDETLLRGVLGRAAAELLAEILEPGDVLGLSWARSLMAMRTALNSLPRCDVVQLTGSLSLPQDDSPIELVRDVARRSDGEAFFFYAPMVLPDAATARVLRTQPEIARAIDAYPRVTKAVVGIGAWKAGLSTVADAVGEQERAAVWAAGVRGELSGVQFDAAGRAGRHRAHRPADRHRRRAPARGARGRGDRLRPGQGRRRGGRDPRRLRHQPRHPCRDGARAARTLMEVLRGGYTNAGYVVRVGDTVRRPWRSTSPATGALLEHLEHVGFEGAPRWLGRDEHGRETLGYVAGAAALEPYQDWMLSDAALVDVAALLRRFHDAVATFDARPYAWPQSVPPAFRDGTISHNDPNLDNVIFADGRAIALIDFDLASPGSAPWDVACAARLWAPLRDPADVPEQVAGRSLERLRLFLDAYGLASSERGRVIDAMVHAHDWCYRIVRGAVQNGHEPFQRMWRDGGEPRAGRTRAWLATHGDVMREAVVDRVRDPRKPVSNE